MNANDCLPLDLRFVAAPLIPGVNAVHYQPHGGGGAVMLFNEDTWATIPLCEQVAILNELVGSADGPPPGKRRPLTLAA